MALIYHILDQFPNVVNGIKDFMHSSFADNCEFLDLYITEQSPNFAHFVLKGPAYSEGEIAIDQNEDTVLVTSENKHLYDRIVKFGLPIKLVNEGSAEDITKFIQDVENIFNDADGEESLPDMIDEFETIISQYISPETDASTDVELDFGNLTPAQRAMLFDTGDHKH